MNLETKNSKATEIKLFSLKSIQMRTFHMTWFAFFLAFFGWFGIAPLMAIVREDLILTQAQIGNTIIASVAITVLVRMLIGPLCDRIGPRRVYTWLLLFGSLPVMGIGLSNNYTTFLIFRLAIGAIGASFVITQHHTSMMFAPNCIGTANATTAGWGNMGGGVTQMVMPLIFTAFILMGADKFLGWRLAMIVPGFALFLTGIVYYYITKDTPSGNYSEIKRDEGKEESQSTGFSTYIQVIKDYRVWALFVIYAACFGVELTINNIAALYYIDNFHLSLGSAGLIAGLFGTMNIFARSVGGFFSDYSAKNYGLRGRVIFLFIVLLGEGVMLMVFSQMQVLIYAVGSMILFSLFVQMSEGATFGIVPFINKKALGTVAGIVGAGGNAGAVAAGFLFRSENISTSQAFLFLSVMVMVASFATLLIRFSPATQAAEKEAIEAALTERRLKEQTGNISS
ncbi:MFS transporter [Candidatus Poribacteria bacterium]|nr:MFS transporter [Candidatus Poribacteria bacterium]